MAQQKRISKYKLAVAVSLVVLAGATYYLIAKDNNKEAVQAPSSSTSLASSLPSQQTQSLDEARKSLSFSPLQPSTKLTDESLSNIKVGSRSGMIDDSDTLYMTYSDSAGTLYKISQTTKTGNYPTDAEKVNLNINGRPIVAQYYRLDATNSGGVNSAGGDAASPTSYLFWSDSGVNYEISEFGRVSKQQLTILANSLKQ